MDATIVDLLKSAKYKHKFPPRHRMLQIKSDLVAKGLLHSGAAITLITETYSESGAEAVLDDFVETVIQNRSSLSLESEEVLLNLVADAFTNVIVEARGCALSEFASNDRFKQLALNHFNEKVSPILEHLQRKVRLKELDLGGKMSPFQITGSQIGNLVLGSVNQSELTAKRLSKPCCSI